MTIDAAKTGELVGRLQKRRKLIRMCSIGAWQGYVMSDDEPDEDCQEAATALSSARAEIERLREALKPDMVAVKRDKLKEWEKCLTDTASGKGGWAWEEIVWEMSDAAALIREQEE